MGVRVVEETVGFSGASSQRAHSGLRTYADSLPLGFSKGTTAGKGTSGIKGEIEVSGIRASAERQLPPDKTPEARQQHFLNPPPHRATEQQHLI